MDRRSQALGGRWGHLQAFGGIRGSSCTCLCGIRGSSFASPWWRMESFTSLSCAYVDRRVYAFDGFRGSSFTSLWWQMESFTSLWWHTGIVVHKLLVADGVIYRPLVAYVDRRVQGFCLSTWIVFLKPLVAYVDYPFQAFGGIHGSSCTRPLMA